MKVQRLAAFCHGDSGGNPAGVVLLEVATPWPAAAEMQHIAKQVGDSETVFAAPAAGGGGHGDGAWKVRYFAPEAEVPFCGHATIALGAALADSHGPGSFALHTRAGDVAVAGWRSGSMLAAALQSPPTRSAPEQPAAVAAALQLFGLRPAALDARMAPARIHAGADHLLLLLNDRATLAAMQYDFAHGQALMRAQGWVTVVLAFAQTPQRFHARNAFAYGGVQEDPATGAAAAALGGHLRAIGWPHGGSIDVQQGDDMGVPSRLHVEISATAGASVRVAGTARFL